VVRPAGTTCATCSFWEDGEDLELKAGLCRRAHPEQVQALRLDEVRGRGALDELVADPEVDEAVVGAVREWMRARSPRLPRVTRTINRGLWPLTFAHDWCGDHPRFLSERS
jgi:hypothetical protein